MTGAPLGLFFAAVAMVTAQPRDSLTAAPSLAGTWRGPKGTARFDPPGTGVMNGEPFRYRLEGRDIVIAGEEASVRLSFAIDGDTLRLIGPAGEITLRRVADAGGPARAQPELAGKWCYVANVNATGGGARMSNQCFTLHADGRYEYHGETDSYGANGGAASQTSDLGSWTATETTLNARSTSGRVTVFGLDKRNHPKTNDPMLVLDGQTFVTWSPKSPWR